MVRRIIIFVTSSLLFLISNYLLTCPEPRLYSMIRFPSILQAINESLLVKVVDSPFTNPGRSAKWSGEAQGEFAFKIDLFQFKEV